MDKPVMHPVKFNGQEAYGINTAIRNINGITVLNAIPTTKGSRLVGDLFNITTGGTIGKEELIVCRWFSRNCITIFSRTEYTTGPSSNYNYIRCR
jgi:hypothetical protein